MVLLNVSIYDYYFILKYLAKEFDGQFEHLAENTDKRMTF